MKYSENYITIFKYFTYAFDYFWLFGILSVINYFLADQFTPLRVASTVGIFIMGFLREYLYMGLFPNLIGKDKLNFKPTLEWLLSYLKVKIAFALAMGILSYYGLFYWKFINTSLSGFEFINDSLVLYRDIYLDFTIMLITKEIQLEFFHKWMHNPISYFPKSWNQAISRLHKFHHKSTTDVTLMTGFFVEFVDVILENLAAPIVIFVLKYYMGFDVKMNLIAFLMLVIFDMHCHSVNPYTQAFYNPILDYYMKPTIAHCLHHVYPRTNHRQIPINHFWHESRNNDLKKYNFAHKTNFI